MKDSEIKKLIREVLEQGYLMSLAVADEHGVWASDVIYIFDDELNIYWMSHPTVRHSKAITDNDQVAGTITVSGPKQDNLGIQFSGVSKKIDGARWDLAKKHYSKRGKAEPKEDDDVLEGDSWYVLQPKQIELIHEKLFGFKKQKYEMSLL